MICRPITARVCCRIIQHFWTMGAVQPRTFDSVTLPTMTSAGFMLRCILLATDFLKWQHSLLAFWQIVEAAIWCGISILKIVEIISYLSIPLFLLFLITTWKVRSYIRLPVPDCVRFLVSIFFDQIMFQFPNLIQAPYLPSWGFHFPSWSQIPSHESWCAGKSWSQTSKLLMRTTSMRLPWLSWTMDLLWQPSQTKRSTSRRAR